MRHLIGSILAITIAGVAAVAATTALLNAPVRTGLRLGAAAAAAPPGESLTQTAEIPDAPPPKGASALRKLPRPRAPNRRPAASLLPPSRRPKARTAEESDEDPYEGIAPEDLPPDLQYDADASVSFPTNT